ncbi:hypothetical protein NBRC116592_18600 [Colwellia sp. KU-HH00111]|uniref:GGDEF domain-containing protein n=1 Tax=Colwellia sp. KU-HH00111 TaxID=3127652 RepID=UPI0031020E90
MSKCSIRVIFGLLIALCSYPLAAADEKQESTGLTQVSEYPLNAQVQVLAEAVTKGSIKTRSLLQQINVEGAMFNYAEQYLILLAKATIKQEEQQHQAVISLIEQAKSLRKHIVEKQLNTPFFSHANLILANSYAAIEDYNNAYLAKKAFVDEYNNYSDAKRENTVKSLTQKYEIAHKKEANALLDNQNQLKALQIGDVNQQQKDQQRNFILIFCTILLFILLFLRQLRIRHKLLILAKTDNLTGLLNRTELFNKGAKLVELANEKAQPLSVVLFDIDNFKQINDDFGHHIGDLVLKKIAGLVSETMRSRDVFARLGGEEFVAILPNTDMDKAKAIAVRVIEKITQHAFDQEGVNYQLTISIGVANLQETKAVFDDIIHAADLAMYQAKAKGQNQMVSYETISDVQERRQR